jgi:hypothetical protein
MKSALAINNNARLVFTINRSKVQIGTWTTSKSGALHAVQRESGMRRDDLDISCSQLRSSAVRSEEGHWKMARRFTDTARQTRRQSQLINVTQLRQFHPDPPASESAARTVQSS